MNGKIKYKLEIGKGNEYSARLGPASGVYDTYEEAAEQLLDDLEPNRDTDPECGGEEWYPLGTTQDAMDADIYWEWSIATIVAVEFEDEEE